MRASTHAITASGATGGIDFRQGVDAVAALVSAPAVKSRAVRVNVTLPEDLLVAIDNSSAGPGGRSGFLAEAARKRLADAEGIPLLSTAKARSGKARPAKQK